MIERSFYFRQLRAMVVRNITLKYRERKKLIWEVCLPLYSFVILALMKLCIPNPNYPALDIPVFPAQIFDNYSLNLNYTIGVVPNTTEVLKFLSAVNNTWYSVKKDIDNELNFIMFDSKEELREMYWHEPTSIPIAVIFHSKTPLSDPVLEYEIRTNPLFAAIPESGALYANLINCRENSNALAKALERSHVLGAESCPAYEYYTSGFATIQMLFDYTKISVMANITPKIPNILLRPFPKESFTANWMLLFRIMIPAYLVMTLSQFIMYLLMIIVKEKETKIKETLKIAGLKDSVFWLSWFIVYGVFVIVMSLIATVSMFLLRVFRHSNFFLILLLILLYGFSLIFLSFMLTPFLNRYKTAGIIGNFSVNIISLLYFIRIFVAKIDDRILWLMSMLSPPAFTLALDKALTLDMDGRGLGFDNLWDDPGPSFGHSLIILCFDNFLYAVLAYYLDLVIPGEYGAKRDPLFFLMPFVKTWKCIFQPGYNTDPTTYASADPIDSNDIEPISQNLKDKVGIDIVDLRKDFTSYSSPSVTAINGLNLTIYEGQITAILGHNGAGKTTLFNILTGMTTPSSGTAYIFGHDIRKPEGLRIARKMFGVCPQHDVLYDNLSPKEHLKLYSGIRGIPVSEQEDEIKRILRETELTNEADTFSKYLSGGQKRKLSVGLAVVGSPKVLIFDEPTAGIDPCSRRYVWSLLQKHKTGKVILLTTHFMDEADLLADRKAVLSKGQLRCVGSSLFLKNKFGIGYHLTLVMEVGNASSEVFRLVRRHVPEAELARHHGKEVSFILPHNSVSKFAPLFNELEAEIHLNGNKLHISSYGISMTTLEEVFLYLEKSEELEGQEGSIGNKILKRRIEGWESRSLRQRRISTNSLNGTPTSLSENSGHFTDFRANPSRTACGVGLEPIETKPKTWNIIKAMIRIRFLNILREPARYMTLAFIPLIFTFIGMHVLRRGVPEVTRISLTLNENTYANGTFIVQKSQNSDLLEYFDPNSIMKLGEITDLINVKPNIGAIAIAECCEEINLTIAYNDTAMHSLPVMLNIANNALYRKFMVNNNDSGDLFEEYKIVTKSYPFVVRSQPEVFDSSLITIAFGLGLQFIVIPIVFATDYVYDREMKAKNQLRVNGLSFSVYYGTYFFVLVVSMIILITFHLTVVYFSDLVPFRQPIAFGMLTFLLYIYTPGAILFGTIISCFFHTAETTQSVLLNLTTFIGFVPFGLVLLLDVLKVRSMYMFIVHAMFSMFDSFYLPFAIVYFVGRIYLLCLSNEVCTYITLKDYFSPEILIILTSCCLQIPMHLLLLQLLEYWKSRPSNSQMESIDQGPSTINANDEHDSDDVKFEKYRVANSLNLNADAPDHPHIILQNLRKRYYGSGDRNLFHKMCSQKNLDKDLEAKNIKVALNGLTFAVGSGEILGLLGHNGAGKTTTMKILTTEEQPNDGKVQLMGYDLLTGNFKQIYPHIGYCPQDDVQWKNITIREHMELYATIRGIPQEKITEITNSYLTGLQITDHADKFSYQCSGGTKRKLSFAIAMIGNPSIVLMDEPSAGMDPHSKRFMWDTILCTLKDDRSAILTTQAMEEADAVCSRVAIMVNGKLKCIGSTQHLKNLYGVGYRLEIKITPNGSSFDKEQKVKQFVQEVFPMATLEETFSEHLVYGIPQSSVKSLALCFTEIEEAKKTLAIEEYSFSQTTLEQIFLKLAHSEERN